MPRYTVLIADDHAISRQGLQTMLEFTDDFEVVGEARNGKEAIAKTADLSPDIVLMDIRMPEVDGLSACKKIKSVAPQTAVLILSAYEKEDDIFRAIEVGACGYLLKDVESDDLLKALRLAGEGLCFLHPAIAKKMFEKISTINESDRRQPWGLTARELETLNLLGKGLSNEKISKELWVTVGTVKTHVSRILRKLGVSDRSQAVIKAIQVGILDQAMIESDQGSEDQEEKPPRDSDRFAP